MCNAATMPATSQSCGGCAAASMPAPTQLCTVVGRPCVYTLATSSTVVWRLTGAICQPGGWAEPIAGMPATGPHNQDCTSPGSILKRDWASALPQPNGCPANNFPAFTNTYTCQFCPSGMRSTTMQYIPIPQATYPSGWIAPAHTIDPNPFLSCQ
jgi:hypothetical protein